MNEEKKAKKVLPSSHSTLEDDIAKATEGMSEKDVMTMKDGAESFMKKMAGNPEKLQKLMDKVVNLDPDKLLDQITKGEGDKEDMELLASAVMSLSSRVDRLEQLINSMPKGDVYD